MELQELGPPALGALAAALLAAGALAPIQRPSQLSGKPSPAVLALGKSLFYDKGLSNPAGLACVSCHDPAAGYTYPNSALNAASGTVPGIVAGRVGSRLPPSVAYTPFLPTGPPHYDKTAGAYVGGLFWDGRARNAVEQAKTPMLDPNEMNNREGNLASPALVVRKLRTGRSVALFKRAYGVDVFKHTGAELIDLAARAIAAYEASAEVSPFSSKYDAYLAGKATLTPQELLGLRLATGRLNGRPDGLPFRKSAHCMDCHALSADLRKAPDLWTSSCYANLGVPRNPTNPYYKSTDRRHNPIGFNRRGSAFVDLGLGGVLYPAMGLPPGDAADGDPLRIDGAFKAPSLRNVDKRPYPSFVKAYMHNGAFKSLKDVVHFYNTRNLTTKAGEVIDFTRPNPYAALVGKPLWPAPEYPDPNTLVNPGGAPAGVHGQRLSARPAMDLDAEQIGNLRLTPAQEDAIVAFLRTLSDGYFKP